MLAMHRTASHVIQRALDFGGDWSHHAIIEAVRIAPEPNSLLDVAQNRYGSFVLEQIIRDCAGAAEVRQRLIEASELLVRSAYGRRVLVSCGVELPLDVGEAG